MATVNAEPAVPRRAQRGDRNVILFVNGTLMRGLALHENLVGAEFLGEAWTAPCYRLQA